MSIEKSVKVINETLAQSHEFSVDSSGFTEDLCLFSNSCSDKINRIACPRVPDSKHAIL